MLPLILFLVLTLAAMAWAFTIKISRQMHLPKAERNFGELYTIGVPAVALLINAVLSYRFAAVGLTVTEHIIQMLACCSIVPLIYMHFAWRVGRSLDNATTLILWLLCLLVLVPGVVFYNPYTPFEQPHFTPKPFTLYVVSHGEALWAIYTGDLVVALQALVTLLRVIPFAHNLRHAGLRFSRPVYAFFAWWLLTAFFIALVSSLDMEQFASADGIWFYYTGMTISAVSINILFALNFDLNPVETEEGEAVENVEVYMERLYAEMARQMERVMTEEQLFRQSGYTVEDMCERLHTNRRVLSQMMLRQYGIYFPEYLNNHRLEYAQQQLLATDMKMEVVAEESGFANRSHMIRLFRQKYGCSPSQWQKEHKEGSHV